MAVSTTPGAGEHATLKRSGTARRGGVLHATFARCRPLVWQAAGISILVNLLMLTGPLFMLQVYDRVLASRSLPTLIALFILTAAMFAFYGVFEFLRGRLMARVGARVQTELGREVFCNSVRAAQDRDPERRRINSIRDLEVLQQALSGPAPMAILDLPWTPVFLLTIFLFHWELGALSIGGSVVLVTLAALNSRANGEPTRNAQRCAARAASFEGSLKGGAEAVEALGMLANATTRWKATHDQALAAEISAADRTGAFGSGSKAFRFLLQSAILAWGAWLAIDQLITPGMIIAASIMAGRALAPIDQTIGQWRTCVRAYLAWRNLSAVLLDNAGTSPPIQLPPVQGHVRARQVAVAIPGTERILLRRLSFVVAPGQALAVIGPTGTGKSALARTLIGLWPARHGTLTLDGASLDQWTRESLGAQIGYLPQDVALIDGTVADNIARLDPAPNDSAIIAAAIDAEAHELILGLPDGYNTRAGPAGTSLSGGQRQRIGLARALFGNPALVVLDEPNAHLDAEGEDAVINVIKRLKNDGKTVVVMAHRPSAVTACDQLLVLVDGQQRAFGPRDRVLGQTGRSSFETAVSISATNE